MSNYMREELIPKTDDKFGQWVIVKGGSRYCLCRCLCGREKEIFTRNLISGGSTKCRSCAAKTQGNRLWDDTKPLRLRRAVKAAIDRCTRKKSRVFHNYGGRGIKVYEPWLKDPRLFVEYLEGLDGWDDSNLVLDRINNDGHYEPGNLRFTDKSTSRQNQRGMVTWP